MIFRASTEVEVVRRAVIAPGGDEVGEGDQGASDVTFVTVSHCGESRESRRCVVDASKRYTRVSLQCSSASRSNAGNTLQYASLTQSKEAELETMHREKLLSLSRR